LILSVQIRSLHKECEHRVLIIYDTVEPKRGKQIEESCKYMWSNKEHKSVNGFNIVSLNYTDTHSTFQLDFSIKMNDSLRKEISDFTTKKNILVVCKEENKIFETLVTRITLYMFTYSIVSYINRMNSETSDTLRTLYGFKE